MLTRMQKKCHRLLKSSISSLQFESRYFSNVATPVNHSPISRNNVLSCNTSSADWGSEKYNLVPFVKEEIRSVLNEVPDFKYYYVGDEDARPYPYKEIPLTEPISLTDDRPDYPTPPVKKDFEFSRLENGLRIVSLDRGNIVANLGLFVHAGSRFEDDSNHGVSQYLESMAYQATAHLSWLRTIKTIETLGVNAGCTAGREHILYHAELERRFVPIMISLITGNVIFPRFLSWEVEKKAKEFNADRCKFESNTDAQITELLHTTAWCNNTLGNQLYPNPRHQKNYEAEIMRSFMLKNFSPDRMVMVGINVDHSELTKWMMRAFVDYESIPYSERIHIPAHYTGGEARVDANTPVSHLAVAFETPGGWNSEDLVPLTVLQTILGGGGSFSTGGPGKGMYTRLYLEVLSTNWIENCVAFNTQYSDSGLFGLYMTSQHGHASNMIHILAHQIKKLGTVTQEELSRAKNALKSSIWMNLENRAVILEDIGRQLLMSGKLMSGRELCNKVDAVTPSDIARAVTRILATEPTVVAYGDTASLPHRHAIVEKIRA